MNEKFENLKRNLLRQRVDLIGVVNLSDSELSEIIKFLNQIIEIINLNSDLVTIIESRQFYLYRGNAKLYLNQYEHALRDYERVKSLLQKGERDFELHYLKSLDGISWSKARMGNYAEALNDCNELIRYSIKNKTLLSKFFTVRGACYKELNKMILAQRSFEFANVNPLFLDAIMQDEGDESLESGYTAKGYNAIGNRYFSQQLFNEALLNYDKAIELNPKYARAYYNRGVILAQKGQQNQAINEFSNSILYEPDFMDAYINRANEYCYISDYKSAINDYKLCIEAGVHIELARENMKYAKSRAGYF